jgi:hypothetical protein
MRHGPRRIGSVVLSVTIACGAVLGATPAAPATPAAAATTPSLEFANSGSQALFGGAYGTALQNLLHTNTIGYDARYDKSGLLDPAAGIVRAGGGYDQPWTRDASVNSWNATSLLSPAVAKNTLWAVVDKDGGGALRVQQDDQQWDQVVWVTAAWHHFLVTGDQEFLGNAYRTAADTLAIREHAGTAGFNATYGLFTGASFFNDGIAGYPAPPADATESVSTGSMPWPGVATGMYLSTNELYYAAYARAADMAAQLRRPQAEIDAFQVKAAALKAAINQHFWNPATGSYDYQLLAGGSRGAHQEGTGLAFALLFGIADPAQARSIIAHAHELPWGMPDTYPNWARYSDEQPGRHNAIVWPLVQGLWAKALAGQGEQPAFAGEVARLAKLAGNNSGFWEIYNGHTGVVDGGWQRLGDTVKFHWGSEPDQTWSATAFLDMVHTGLFGMTFTADGLAFAPDLPAGWGDVTLRNLRYRNANLTIALHGAGTRVGSFTLDGKPVRAGRIPATLSGEHRVEITLTGAAAGDRDGDRVPDAQDRCADTAGTVAGCPAPAHLEAEDARNTGGVKTNVNHTGYTGRAFVDGLWADGAASAFTLNRASAAAEKGAITVRYANANNDPSTMTLSVDGHPVRQVTFPKVSDSWDAWGTVTFGDLPVSGTGPVLTLSCAPGDTGRVNLDWLEYRTAASGR